MSGDFGTMQNRIADELARSDLGAQIQSAILSAIRFYESERLWFNEGESTAGTVAGQQSYAVPSDFLEADTLTITISGNRYLLCPRPWAWMRDMSVASTSRGRPTDWSYYADQLWLYPVPDGVYTLTLSYLKRLAALAVAGDANAWMTHGEELVRARAKADVYAHVLHDFDEALAMKQLETEALGNLRVKSTKKLATGRLQPTGF
jgi:hypothetical protein